jgi:hypothetical protein
VENEADGQRQRTLQYNLAGTAGSPLMFPGTTGTTSMAAMRAAHAAGRMPGRRRPAELTITNVPPGARRAAPSGTTE